MENISPLSYERQTVLNNINEALLNGNHWQKAEIGDHAVSPEERERLASFDNRRRGTIKKIKSFAALRLADSLTAKFNKNTAIVGIENAFDIDSGAVITSNHYNPTDSTPIRMLARAMGKRDRLHIMVQESNMLMTGLFGFLMKNCNTHPYVPSATYLTKSFMPFMEELLSAGDLLLVYPEAEMWYNYKKPRRERDGAFHIAAKYGVPVIPTFTEMITLNGERDANGFLPVRHILHVLPPIYPDQSLSFRENRAKMQKLDYELKCKLYEEIYGVPLDDSFIPERDIAGIKAQN